MRNDDPQSPEVRQSFFKLPRRPSRWWGIILLVPCGVWMLIASVSLLATHYSRSGSALLAFGVSFIVGGIGVFLRLSWAPRFVAFMSVALMSALAVGWILR